MIRNGMLCESIGDSQQAVDESVEICEDIGVEVAKYC